MIFHCYVSSLEDKPIGKHGVMFELHCSCPGIRDGTKNASPGHSRELPSLVFVGKAPKSRVSRNLTKVDADVAMVEKHSQRMRLSLRTVDEDHLAI